jgi:predicted small integral membrane protein
MDFAWMAWTWETAAFYAAIAAALGAMTALALVKPETARVGVLGLATTRGDRLFLSLLGSAFIHLGWLALAGAMPAWGGSVLSLIYATAVFRWA